MAGQGRPSVRLTDDEAWDLVTNSHTGVLTTLRASGAPISLPVWFAVVDRRIYVSTRGKKVRRIRANPTASFLVEDGERWAELRAVHLSGSASAIEPDADLAAAVAAELDRKYARYRTELRDLPDATRARYGEESVLVVFEPTGEILTWDNAKLARSS